MSTNAEGPSLRKQRIFSLYARGEIALDEVSRRIGEIRPGPASVTWLTAIVKALASWWYWQSREGSTRRREVAAIDDVLSLCEPNYREMVERIVKGNIVRPAGHFDVPAKWRRR